MKLFLNSYSRNTDMDSFRPLLKTYAYNILGSVEEAKDIVQEAFLKFMEQDEARILDKKAYLVRTVINLAINHKKRQKKIIANYPGEWLPEPVATEKADSLILGREMLSYSLLVMMEKLNARQRAVFVLKEAFDYDHEEIGGLLGIKAENSRQLLTRAKAQLKMDKPGKNNEIPDGWLEKYLEVIREGDVGALEKLLTEEIRLVADGGGKVIAFMKPVIGRHSVAALLSGVFSKSYSGVLIEQNWVNHQPALFYYLDGKLITCQIFSIVNGLIENIYMVRNPDKLRSL